MSPLYGRFETASTDAVATASMSGSIEIQVYFHSLRAVVCDFEGLVGIRHRKGMRHDGTQIDLA